MARIDLSLAQIRVESAAYCAPTDAVGMVLSVQGAGVDGIPTLGRADIMNPAKMPGFGLLVSKSSPILGRVVVLGVVDIPNLLPGKRYFVGNDGFLTPVPIATPGAFVQPVGLALDARRLFFNPQDIARLAS